MPHFVIDCARELLSRHPQEVILREVHQAALESGLFQEAAIKVRLNPYDSYLAGGTAVPFLHLFAHILSGRTEEQKAALSRRMVTLMMRLFPDLEKIAASVYEMDRAGYVNRQALDPKGTQSS